LSDRTEPPICQPPRSASTGRLQAALIHLLATLFVVALLGGVAALSWYPGFLFPTDGGWQGLRILLVVTLVSGPLLTALVFRRGKKGLAGDLTWILVVQLLAFAIGARTLWQERPLALVYADGAFHTTSRDDWVAAGLDVPDSADLPGSRPHRVHMALPQDPAAQNRIRARLIAERQPVYTLSRYYEPLTGEDDWLAGQGLDRAAIRAGGEAGIEDWLATLPGAPSRYRLFPYISRYDLYFLALEADTLEIVDVHRPPSGYRFGQLPIRALTPPATAATDDSGAES
jgi:hypothetical protein